MNSTEIKKELDKKLKVHNTTIQNIEKLMDESKTNIENLKKQRENAFDGIDPKRFKELEKDISVEESTIKMCEKRLNELKEERLFTRAELEDYVQDIYNEIESDDEKVENLLKDFLAELVKIGKETIEKMNDGNKLIKELEKYSLSLDELNGALYQRGLKLGGSHAFDGHSSAIVIYNYFRNYDFFKQYNEDLAEREEPRHWEVK